MSRYDDFQGDDIDDKVDKENVAVKAREPQKRFDVGLTVGVLAALALIIMVAWSSGWLGVSPLPTSTVSQVPPTPPPAPPH